MRRPLQRRHGAHPRPRTSGDSVSSPLQHSTLQRSPNRELGAGYAWCFVMGGELCASASPHTPINSPLLRGSTRAAWKNCTDPCSCTLDGRSASVPVAEVGCSMHPIGSVELVATRLSTEPRGDAGSWTLAGWCYVAGGQRCERAVPSKVYGPGAALRPCWPLAIACACSTSAWSGTELVTEFLSYSVAELGCQVFESGDSQCITAGGLDCTRAIRVYDIRKKSDFGVAGTLRSRCASDCNCMTAGESSLDLRSKLDVSLTGCGSQISRMPLPRNAGGGQDLFCFVQGGQSCASALALTTDFTVVSARPIGPKDSTLAVKTCTSLKEACACTATGVSGGVKVGTTYAKLGYVPFVGCGDHRGDRWPQCYTAAGNSASSHGHRIHRA
jgi:hypothetical protein